MNRNTKTVKKNNLNTLDKVLLLCALSTVCFTITMIVCFFVCRAVPDTLIVSWFSALFGECGCCTIIWKSKKSLKGETNPDVSIETHDKF